MKELITQGFDAANISTAKVCFDAANISTAKVGRQFVSGMLPEIKNGYVGKLESNLGSLYDKNSSLQLNKGQQQTVTPENFTPSTPRAGK